MTRNYDEPPRIGCLGVGWIGRDRMRAVAESRAGRIVAIHDPDVSAAKQAAALVPWARLVGDLDRLLDLELDGIMIATPSAQHADQAIAALERGSAVFCQKPLARSAVETERVIAAARRADRLLAIDLSYRHVAGVPQMRELVCSGALGRVFAVELRFHDACGPDKPWFRDLALAGGGCLIDRGVHLVDLALWITGAKRVQVIDRACFAGGEPLRARTCCEDYAHARLRLDDRIDVSLACSWNLHAGQDAVIEAVFHGTSGAVRLRNLGGSFYDFAVERLDRTSVRTVAQPPDPWGGRAAVAWARALARSRTWDPEIGLAHAVAAVLDHIYANPSSA